MQELNIPMSSLSHSHRRQHSGELHVFEATRYFSGVGDVGEAGPRRAMRTERRSLDMPIEAQAPKQRVELNHNIKEKIKCKQPSSPGGKLASFLNSFFQQYSASRKKKASKLVKSEEERSGRRKKRESISYSKSMSTTDNANSWYYTSSCSSSGFRTPSLHSKKREEGFKDEVWGDEFRLKMRLEEEFNITREDKEVKDDGGESDSSSDLFELKNYDFGELSSGLPVYGSTDMGVIRGGGGFASTVLLPTSW